MYFALACGYLCIVVLRCTWQVARCEVSRHRPLELPLPRRQGDLHGGPGKCLRSPIQLSGCSGYGQKDLLFS